MKPEDQTALNDFIKKTPTFKHLVHDCSDHTLRMLLIPTWEAALAHRDAQASAINEQMLDLLKSFGHKSGCMKNAFYDQCTCGVDAAIAAAEANRGNRP